MRVSIVVWVLTISSAYAQTEPAQVTSLLERAVQPHETVA
jgi:hypothetical protein